ncbi:LigA [Rathayibacter toxicus]|nr:LigA [Rathayibacter toxicus]
MHPETEPFLAPVAMEEDSDELFVGDRGVLDLEVRRVLVQVLHRRFLLADRHREQWTVLLEHQQLIESRLNEMFVRLVVDHERGVAYKQQVRSDEFDVPILLRDLPYSRPETLVLVHLRTVYQRETATGELAAHVDSEDVEQTVLSYFSDGDRDTAKRQRMIRKALERLGRDGIVDEESAGRFRISPLVEIVLSAEKLRELRDWLQRQSVSTVVAAGDDGEDSDSDDDLLEVQR